MLVDGDVTIPDSSVIVAYLERAYPDRPLYPATARDLARALWLEEYADTRLREATLPYFAERIVKQVFQNRPADEVALAKAHGLRDETFDYLEKQLADGALPMGAQISIAHIAIGAQLVTYVQGGETIAESRWPKLAAHFGDLKQRPVWRAVLDEEAAALATAR